MRSAALLSRGFSKTELLLRDRQRSASTGKFARKWFAGVHPPIIKQLNRLNFACAVRFAKGIRHTCPLDPHLLYLRSRMKEFYGNFLVAPRNAKRCIFMFEFVSILNTMYKEQVCSEGSVNALLEREMKREMRNLQLIIILFILHFCTTNERSKKITI